MRGSITETREAFEQRNETAEVLRRHQRLARQPRAGLRGDPRRGDPPLRGLLRGHACLRWQALPTRQAFAARYRPATADRGSRKLLRGMAPCRRSSEAACWRASASSMSPTLARASAHQSGNPGDAPGGGGASAARGRSLLSVRAGSRRAALVGAARFFAKKRARSAISRSRCFEKFRRSGGHRNGER